MKQVSKKASMETAVEIAKKLYFPKPSGGWISVKERLPDPGERVLVYIGAVFEAYIDDGGKWMRYYAAPLDEVLGTPTHWMPLPEPPKVTHGQN